MVTKRRFLEAFWESDAPRFGDIGAQGWGVWLVQAEAVLRQRGTDEGASAAAGASGPTPGTAGGQQSGPLRLPQSVLDDMEDEPPPPYEEPNQALTEFVQAAADASQEAATERVSGSDGEDSEHTGAFPYNP